MSYWRARASSCVFDGLAADEQPIIGRVDETSEVVGAVMRPTKLRELAQLAGFSSVEILPIEHPFWKFYRLNP